LIYCVLQLPNALVTNFPGFCVLRFLSGFVGSPALATGGESVTRRATEHRHHVARIEPELTCFPLAGASLSDAFAPHKLPYAMALYNLAAASAPGLGPILSGFAVDVLGWRWAFWEMLLLSAGSLIILSFTMPEVSDTTKRAQMRSYYLPSTDVLVPHRHQPIRSYVAALPASADSQATLASAPPRRSPKHTSQRGSCSSRPSSAHFT
jgi:MFS family permease